jgi:predicted dehydrogenase
LKVAIVGIGQIAEAHISEIIQIPNIEIVALVDLRSSPLRALCEKYDIASSFNSCTEMLATSKPDVVHITTPPGPHLSLAKECIESGAHVYIEKPLTITHTEAEQLIEFAERYKKKVYLGANRFFAPEQQKALDLIKQGSIGRIAHIDTIFSYDLQGIFGRQVMTNPKHWIAQLPGQIFQNNLNHPLATIVPFLSDDLEIKPWAADWSGNGVVNEELRVSIIDKTNHLTANIIFTSNVKPSVFKTRYFGSKQTVSIDNYTHSYVLETAPTLPGILGNIFNIRKTAKSLKKQFWLELYGFFFGKRTYFSDMKESFEHFYRCVRNDEELPISHKHALLASKIMQDIFDQIGHPSDKGGAV